MTSGDIGGASKITDLRAEMRPIAVWPRPGLADVSPSPPASRDSPLVRFLRGHHANPTGVLPAPRSALFCTLCLLHRLHRPRRYGSGTAAAAGAQLVGSRGVAQRASASRR